MPAAIGRAPHHAVERVDLADQMALAEAADGRVAGHLADGLGLVGQQRRARAAARGRRRRLAAGMAAADDDDVVMLSMRCDMAISLAKRRPRVNDQSPVRERFT